MCNSPLNSIGITSIYTPCTFSLVLNIVVRHAYLHIQEEVVRKTELFEQMKVESEKCLAQSERITIEKVEFESEMYAKVTFKLLPCCCFIVIKCNICWSTESLVLHGLLALHGSAILNCMFIRNSQVYGNAVLLFCSACSRFR